MEGFPRLGRAYAATVIALGFLVIGESLFQLYRAPIGSQWLLLAGLTLIRRLALVIDDGVIAKVFYPVFPPDKNASEVHAWLREHRRP